MIVEIEQNEELFNPRAGGQTDFWNDWESPYIALCGGWGSGKTYIGSRKLAELHILNAFDEDGQPTYCAGQVVGQDYQQAQSVCIPNLQEAFDEMNLSWRFVADRSKFWFEFPDLGTVNNPSRIFVRSADAPEKINAYTVAHGWGDEVARWPRNDEDPKRDALLQFKGRLRDPKARVLQGLFTFTPEGQETSVYKIFEESPLPGHKLYRARTRDNVGYEQWAEMQGASLTPELARQYLEGETISFRGGLVFRNFARSIHATREIKPDPKLPLQLSIDFNIDPGMHAVIGQYDSFRNRIVALAEIHEKDMTTIRMLEEFKLWATARNPAWPEIHVFGDPAGGQRDAASGLSKWTVVRTWFRDYMNDYPVRFRYKASHSPVADGVNAINLAFKPINGDPFYFIDPSCKRLIEDYATLKWDGNKISKDMKNRGHAADAERYRVEILAPVRRQIGRSPIVGSV